MYSLAAHTEVESAHYLTDDEILMELVRITGKEEVAIFSDVFAYKGQSSKDAWYAHHLYVLGGRASVGGLREYYQHYLSTP